MLTFTDTLRTHGTANSAAAGAPASSRDIAGWKGVARAWLRRVTWRGPRPLTETRGVDALDDQMLRDIGLRPDEMQARRCSSVEQLRCAVCGSGTLTV